MTKQEIERCLQEEVQDAIDRAEKRIRKLQEPATWHVDKAYYDDDDDDNSSVEEKDDPLYRQF